MRNVRNSKGFTLIELMIVVVIIGILAAIAIPKFSSVSNGAKEAEADPVLKQLCSLAEGELFMKNNAWTGTEASLSFTAPTSDYYTYTYLDGTATATAKAGTKIHTKTMDCATKDITLGAIVS